MTKYLPLLLLPILAGCPENPPKAKVDPSVGFLSNFPSAPTTARDANPDPPMFVQLSVYRLAVPARAVSHNEEFWKHVTEDNVVDVGAHDLLFANGVRVGIAPRGDWDYFKKILEANSVITQKTSSSGVAATTIEMPLKQKVPQQFITFFHPVNGLVGQVYDRCENSMMIRFEPVPRQPGDVRLTITPMLRAERTELMYTVRNESRELNFVQPEYLFDMKLSVDVPLDHFLIVAPSTDSDISTSLGRRFLYLDGNGQEFEQVLLISPQPFQFNEKASTQPTTLPANLH